MKGKRADIHTRDLKPGHYSNHNEDGGLTAKEWYAVTPNGILTHIGGLPIEEHEDGTITVEGLIQATMEDGKAWKGYLERGVWKEAKE